MKPETDNELDQFRQKYPDVEALEVLIADMNGQYRMKQTSIAALDKISGGSFVLPCSVSYLTTTGDTPAFLQDNFGADPDGLCSMVAGSLVHVPWARKPTAQVQCTLSQADGSPLFSESRAVAAGMIDQAHQAGYFPVVAFEYEFYLFHKTHVPPQPARPLSDMPVAGGENYLSPYVQSDFQPLLDAIRAAAEQQNIPVDGLMTECGEGQFEVNLHHDRDPLKAADHAMMLKRVIKSVADQFGFLASFMAKPVEGAVGSGMHMHMSVLDTKGDNIFGGKGEAALNAALAGLLSTMADSMAVFAPNANSYRRFDPGLYVPIAPTWGENDRRVSLRIPVSDADNRRIEHRVAGADASPYMVLTMILSGLLAGLQGKCAALDEVNYPPLPLRWSEALNLFEASDFAKTTLGDDFHRAYATIRREEENQMHRMISEREHHHYLRVI